MSDLHQFVIDLDKAFQEKVEGRVTRVHRWISMEAFRRVIMMSPVEHGRFKGNWQIGVGDIPEGTLEVTDPTGEATIAKGLAATADLPPNTVIFLVNNLPYARPLEEGHSKQAPQGMVGVVVAEIQTFIANIPPSQDL